MVSAQCASVQRPRGFAAPRKLFLQIAKGPFTRIEAPDLNMAAKLETTTVGKSTNIRAEVHHVSRQVRPLACHCVASGLLPFANALRLVC